MFFKKFNQQIPKFNKLIHMREQNPIETLQGGEKIIGQQPGLG